MVDNLKSNTIPDEAIHTQSLRNLVAIAKNNRTAGASAAARSDFRSDFIRTIANIRQSAASGAIDILRFLTIALVLIEEAKALGTDLEFLQHDPLTFKDLHHGTFGLTFRGVNSDPHMVDDPEVLVVVTPRSSGGGEVQQIQLTSEQIASFLSSSQAAADTLAIGQRDLFIQRADLGQDDITGSAARTDLGSSIGSSNSNPQDPTSDSGPSGPTGSHLPPPTNTNNNPSPGTDTPDSPPVVPRVLATPVVTAVSNDTGSNSHDGVTSDRTLLITGSAEAGSIVTVFLGNSSIGTATADSSGHWSFDYTGTSLADGTYAFTAQASDAAGETSLVSAALTVTIDTTIAILGAPDLQTASDSAGPGGTASDNLTSDTTPSFTIDVSTATAGDTIELLNGGASFATPVTHTLTAADIAAGSYTLTADTLGTGAHDIAVKLSDAAGNSSASAALTVTIDNILPSAPIVASVANDTGANNHDNVTTDRTLLINGSAEAGSSVTVLLEGSSIGIATADGRGHWTFDYTGTPLADGTYHFTATATDLAGNISDPSAALTVKVDGTAPTVNVDIAASALDDTHTSSLVTFVFSETPFDFISADIAVTGGTITNLAQDLVLDPTGHTYTATFTETAGFAGAGSVAVTAGSYTDLAGNLGVMGSDTVSINPQSDPNDFDNGVPGTADQTQTGGPGDDTLSGGNHSNVLIGLGGNDILNGSNSVDYLYGGSGDDQLKGENSGDFIYGGSGSDQISGGAGNDNLYGGSGADTIDGDNGSDLIVGGYGADQLTGGSGSNTFVYLSIRDSTPTEFDVITDWSAGTNKIDLSAIDANSSADGLQNFTSVTNTSTLTAHQVVWFYDVSSNETIIKADVNGDTTADLEIHLTGNITLHQSDFTLV